MARAIANADPKELREVSGEGLMQCLKRIKTAQLLDRAESAETVEQIRSVVAEFITLVTGEK